MTLPTTWPTVPVFGTYLRVDGTPNEGSVWFETSQRVVVLDENGLTIGVVPRRIIANLDATGHFMLDLPCTDAGAQPTGWTWQVYERFNSGQPVYSIEVPQALAAQGINLAQYPHAVPVPVAPPVVSYLTTADIGVTVADQVGVNTAISTANAASTTASAAQAAAGDAVTTANAASATANAIDGKAQSALDNSNAAVTTANTASATATAAQNTANAIDGKAQSALDNSNAAVTTANAASATANAIDGKAQSALDNSNAAVTTANAASATATAASNTANAILPITTAKMLGTGSTAGQVPVSQGAASAPAWGWTSPGFKNLLINGNFDFWQRGTSWAAYANSIYTADRWIDRSAGTTIAPSRQSFATGQTAVPNGPAYFHRAVIASVAGASNYARSEYRMEGVAPSAGQICTLSFWAKADAPKKLATEFAQYFGSGGAPSAPALQIGVTQFSLTTAWQKFSATIVMPSIAGATMGTNGDDTLRFWFWYDAGSTFNVDTGTMGQQSGTFDIAQVQLEVGSVPTPFEMRPFGLELSLCQRYFEKSYDVGTAPGTNTTLGIMQFFMSPLPSATYTVNVGSIFKVEKRAVPSVTPYTTAGVSGKVRDAFGGADVTPISSTISTKTFSFGAVTTAAMTAINMQGHWTADAEL